MQTLKDKIAVVAGATRGAGRGIACMLSEAGATVYCTGRSVRGKPTTGNRPETIEETAEMVCARGGVGIPVQIDHTVENQVSALFERVKAEYGRLDVLVNDFWGGHEVTDFGKSFWEISVEKGWQIEQHVYSHILTSRYAAPLMVERGQGLIVEVIDGDTFGYRGNLYYDLAITSIMRVTYSMATELRTHNITSLALTPGYLRSELILDKHGVSEANWQEGAQKDPHFIASETPFYVGRAVAALASDPDVLEKSGYVFSSWGLALEYGFTDIDGRQPNWDTYMEGINFPNYKRVKKCDEAFYAYWVGLFDPA